MKALLAENQSMKFKQMIISKFGGADNLRSDDETLKGSLHESL